MIDKLLNIYLEVKQDLHKPNLNDWDSLLINRRKPETVRIFRYYGDYRVCLHRFVPCMEEESFLHPHAWPAAIKVLKGGYWQSIGVSPDLHSQPVQMYKSWCGPGCYYEITDPHIWHSVTPDDFDFKNCPTFTIMLNGKPWDKHHDEVRTTKGKDLEKLSDREKLFYLQYFGELL